MKKIILLLLLVVCISTPMFADITYGVKGGVAQTTLFKDVDNDGSDNMAIGGQAGVFAEIGLLGPLTLQTELLYRVRGWKDKDNADLYFNYSTIDIPVKVKLDLIPLVMGQVDKMNLTKSVTNSLKLNLYAGGYYLFVLDVENCDQTDVKKADFEDGNMGLVVGVELVVGQFLVDVGGSLSSNKLFDNEAYVDYLPYSYGVTVGYRF
jgi:hypothetical protein